MKYEINSFGATHIIVAVTVKGKRTFRTNVAVAKTRADAESYIAKKMAA